MPCTNTTSDSSVLEEAAHPAIVRAETIDPGAMSPVVLRAFGDELVANVGGALGGERGWRCSVTSVGCGPWLRRSGQTVVGADRGGWGEAVHRRAG